MSALPQPQPTLYPEPKTLRAEPDDFDRLIARVVIQAARQKRLSSL